MPTFDQRLGNFPARRQIQAWLRAGYLEHEQFFSTTEGTPQGGPPCQLLVRKDRGDLPDLDLEISSLHEPAITAFLARYGADRLSHAQPSPTGLPPLVRSDQSLPRMPDGACPDACSV
jgi:hypothetical protein